MAAMGAARDTKEIMGYIRKNPPKGAGVSVSMGVSPEQYKKHRRLLIENKEVQFLDARNATGGVGSFDLDIHGFTLIKPPPPMDFTNGRAVKKEYYPKLVELVKEITGGKAAYMFQHLIRDENPQYSGQAYSRFAHTDASAATPPSWRRMLANPDGRYKVPEEELANSDICMYNIWHPRDRPAYKDPLCLLDCTSVDPEDISRIPYIEGIEGKDEIKERDTASDDVNSVIGFLVGPSYNPKHRWYFLPDQKPDEAWLFKQYDERYKGTPKVSNAFHNSFHDPFYDAMPKETHGRRSAEFRVLVTFPKKDAASKL